MSNFYGKCCILLKSRKAVSLRCNVCDLQSKEVGVLREDQVKLHQMKNEFEKMRGKQEEAKVCKIILFHVIVCGLDNMLILLYH